VEDYVVLFDSDIARVGISRRVNSFDTGHLELTHEAVLSSCVVESVETILWIVRSILPVDVVPTLVDILVGSMKINPC